MADVLKRHVTVAVNWSEHREFTGEFQVAIPEWMTEQDVLEYLDEEPDGCTWLDRVHGRASEVDNQFHIEVLEVDIRDAPN